jgi:APA family basic amino acid/polyamine antiporter
MCIAAFAAAICYIGIKQSAFVNGLVVLLKVGVILAVIGFGAGHVVSANWHPFIPPNTGVFGEFGWSGIIRASGVIFFAYIGFDAVSTAAQESRNPTRDLPFGLLMGLTICTVLYILMAGTLTGLMPYRQLNDAAPVALAMESTAGLHWLSIWVIFGALAGLTSVILVMILAQSRILLSMSQDGLLPPALGRVHERFRTPSVATVLTGAFASLMAGLFPLGILAELVSIGTLVAFIMVCASVLVLRYRRPDLPRPFRVAWPWLTCLAGVAFCTLMAAGLSAATWGRLIVWTIIGTLIYFFYGRHHSKLKKYVKNH